MPNIRPLREGYEIAKDTKRDIKSNIRPIVDYAVKGNSRFVFELKRISWNSLSAKNVFDVILLMLSYGLKTKKELFEKYIRQENMKGTASLFNFMRKYDGTRIKNCLNTGSFRNVFSSLFDDIDQEVDWEKELNELCTRVTKITANNIKPEESADLNALIDSIILGRNIDPVYNFEDEDLQ